MLMLRQLEDNKKDIAVRVMTQSHKTLNAGPQEDIHNICLIL